MSFGKTLKDPTDVFGNLYKMNRYHNSVHVRWAYVAGLGNSFHDIYCICICIHIIQQISDGK